MTKTFQEFFSENLAEFGWTLSATDIPEWDTYTVAVHRVGDWWDGLDPHNRDIFRGSDFSLGLYQQGYFTDWPGLYSLLEGNVMGTFDKTYNDILACGRRAHYQVDEQTEAVSNVHEVVGS
jgi:hypothetical protein